MSESRKVQVSLFGVLDIRIDGVSQHVSVSGPTRSLLHYLFCFHDRLTRREQLMEMFWSHTKVERRRSSLNSAIWRINKALKPYPSLDIDATANSVRLVGVTAPDVEVDVICLEKALRKLDAAGEPRTQPLAELLSALDLCGAIPLDGLEDDWAMIERERLVALRMRGLTWAMRALAAMKRYDEALEMGRRILVQEPYRECALQEVLCLLVLNGQRARVMQLYDSFHASLLRELGIEPMAETKALRDYLASDGCHGPAQGLYPAAAVGETASRPGVEALLCTIEHSRIALRASA